MHIFICWSEDRSHELATTLCDSLPRFVSGLTASTSSDIAKGTRWFDAVSKELDTADAGLVCLTREALQSGWIHFEAGALARAVRMNKREGRLYTYLLGVEPDELRGPLSEFQSTKFEREDTRKLCDSIVASMKKQEAPARDVWEKAFDDGWVAFEKAVKAIGPLPAEKIIPGLEDIFRRKTFREPIEECTRQAWIDRFTGVRETIARLRTFGPVMQADNSYLLDLYNELLEQLDVYSMNMGALLLTETRFTLNTEDGKLEIGKGITRACESHRGTIRQLVAHLLAPNCAPVLERESRRYRKLGSFEEKKTLMIHPAQNEIQAKWDGTRTSKADAEQLSRCAGSLWEFDRIYFYLVQEQRSDLREPGQLIDCLDRELEKLKAVEGGGSLIPLHYAIRALKKTVERIGETPPPKADLLLSAIELFLTEYDLDKGRQVRDNIKELRTIVAGLATAAAKP